MLGKWFFGLCDRLFAVLGALVLIQTPIFYQHYLQQLGGHVAELEWQIESLNTLAHSMGYTLAEYVDKLSSHEETLVASQGSFLQQLLTRSKTLHTTYLSMERASLWKRPFYLMTKSESSLLLDTWNHYEPGFAFTLESALYALLGIILGYGSFRALQKLLSIPFLLLRLPWNREKSHAIH